MDPLSEVLRAIRLTGGVFLEAHFSAPWCVVAHITPEDCAPFLVTPAQIIAYHFVLEGRLLLQIDGHPQREISAGEIVLLPRNDRHLLASAPDLQPVRADQLIQPAAAGGLAQICHGGGGQRTRLVCGFLGCEHSQDPLIATLPPVLTLNVREGTAREWVEASVRFAAGQLAAGQIASSASMSRLSELLFVEAVRHYATTPGSGETGWLRGVRDRHIGRALACIHNQLDGPWTVAALAREAALSRSAFVERFTTVVGMPPIRYLTHWRMHTAKNLLRTNALAIAQIAGRVGYESEEAFNRAFKREFGMPPARWRDQSV